MLSYFLVSLFYCLPFLFIDLNSFSHSQHVHFQLWHKCFHFSLCIASSSDSVHLNSMCPFHVTLQCLRAFISFHGEIPFHLRFPILWAPQPCLNFPLRLPITPLLEPVQIAVSLAESNKTSNTRAECLMLKSSDSTKFAKDHLLPSFHCAILLFEPASFLPQEGSSSSIRHTTPHRTRQQSTHDGD